MATTIKFYKGSFGANYSFANGGVYFDTTDHLIKIGTGTGVETFAGVRSASFESGILKLVNESGVELNINLSDVASATAVEARLKAIEDDYLVAADKTELEGKISTAAAAASAAQATADSAVSAASAAQEAADKAQATADTAVTAASAAQATADAAVSAVSAEKDRATAAEAGLQAAIDAERDRATAAEAGLSDDISDVASDLADEIDRATAAEAGLDARIKALEEDGSVEGLAARVTAAETTLTTLTGGSAVTGSVQNIVNAAIDDFATKVSDDNTVNSFKELVDWAAAHGSEAAEMAAGISANAEAIEGLQGLVGTSSVAAQVSAGIAGIASASATGSDNGVEVIVSSEAGSVKSVTVNAATLAGRVEALEGLFEGDNSVDAKIEAAKDAAIAAAATAASAADAEVLQDAKDYADGLAGNYASAAQGVKADSALQSVSATAAGSTFISAAAADKADNAQAITVTVTMGSMNDDKITVKSDGFATVADVANAVAAGVSATTLVGASAEDGDIKVTVADGEISAAMSWATFA